MGSPPVDGIIGVDGSLVGDGTGEPVGPSEEPDPLGVEIGLAGPSTIELEFDGSPGPGTFDGEAVAPPSGTEVESAADSLAAGELPHPVNRAAPPTITHEETRKKRFMQSHLVTGSPHTGPAGGQQRQSACAVDGASLPVGAQAKRSVVDESVSPAPHQKEKYAHPGVECDASMTHPRSRQR